MENEISTVMNEQGILTIQGIRCYEKNGVVYLNTEDVARGLGFTQIAKSGNEVVRWERVIGYLKELGIVPTCGDGVLNVATCCNGGSYKSACPPYIPENIFYRLCMKGKNEAAETFQAKVADEVIPTIRKTGGYVSNDDLFIETYFSTVDESTKAVLRTTLSTVREQNKRIVEMKPKEDYYNALVDRGTNLSFRNTAKEIGAPEKRFVRFLLGNGYVYRNKNGQLEPYAEHVKNGLFVMKESKSEKTKWSGSQTLITVQGRDKLRKEYWERGDKQC